MQEWALPALASLLTAIVLAIIGGLIQRKNQSTPAYKELLQEIQELRDDRREDRESIKALEAALEEEQKGRRDLSGRVDCLETLRGRDRAWIRRTIERVVAQAPGQVELLRPFPSWMTDPDGIPAVPDDGQPYDITRP